MKKFLAILTMTLVIACSSKKEGNMIVQGSIEGLKKGKLYLQKMKDTVLISVDSISLKGTSDFILTDNIDEPQMFYLTFDGNTSKKRIMFFGEEGTITINDNVEQFGFKPVITGSKNQEILNNFNEINQKFKLQRLDFIAKDIEARAKKDTAEVTKLKKDYEKMMRRRFLYTTNFAVNHKDSEASPYIALSELFDANIFFLDTINNSLTDKVKNSIYGKRLDKYIADVKAKK